MVSRRKLSDYVGRHLKIKDAVYLVYPISQSLNIHENSALKIKKPVQEEVLYDSKKLDWVVRVGAKHLTMDELRKGGYNISHMVFPVPVEKFSSSSDQIKYGRIINEGAVFFNLKTGKWSYIVGERGNGSKEDQKIKSGPLVEENVQNKLYECLYELIREEVSPSLHKQNRDKIAKFIVNSMGRLHTKIDDLEELLNNEQP